MRREDCQLVVESSFEQKGEWVLTGCLNLSPKESKNGRGGGVDWLVESITKGEMSELMGVLTSCWWWMTWIRMAEWERKFT